MTVFCECRISKLQDQLYSLSTARSYKKLVLDRSVTAEGNQSMTQRYSSLKLIIAQWVQEKYKPFQLMVKTLSSFLYHRRDAFGALLEQEPGLTEIE